MPDQSLALHQDQRQVQILAPQLRQSLELLQLPMLELRTTIQNELQLNPALEEIPPDRPALEAEEPLPAPADPGEFDFRNELAALTGIDDEWRSYFAQEHDAAPYDPGAEKRRSFFFDSQTQKISLQCHLERQLGLAGLNEADHQIGILLIGNIDDDGFLTQDTDELAAASGSDRAHLRDILALIQDFDPVGVGARDLRECLLLQLERLGHGDSLAAGIVRGHLEQLGHKHFKEIARALGVSIEEVHQAAKLIAALDPKPGRAYTAETPHYVLPDVTVELLEGQYRVILNNGDMPGLRISRRYHEMMNSSDTDSDARAYIKERIKSGMFLIKSIAQHQQTLFRVATAIVNAQTDFLEHGIAHLKPLTMSEIARVVGLHETTVCRCIANKHMQTPIGLFEMKFFFTPGLKTSDGSAMSNKCVQDMIAAIVGAEDPERPLSDQDILEKLEAQGVKVARRTVAKYRIAMKILPSHLRKSS